MKISAHVLKLCSVILQFFGVLFFFFDMARLICNSLRTFILSSLTKFQEKKILSGCFRFNNLNLELAEAIKILKATTQCFGISKIAYFWNNENSLHYFTILLINCTWIGLLLPSKNSFGPQFHLALYLFLHHPVLFFILKMLITLVSDFLCSNIFIGFPIFGFWIFWILNISEDLRLSFYVFYETKEKPNYPLWMVFIQIRTS